MLGERPVSVTIYTLCVTRLGLTPRKLHEGEPDMGPHPAVAAIRLAVRRVLHDVLSDHTRPPGESSPLVLVACSGGADSMALASALAFEAPKLGIRAGGITVDHGLQPGSDLRADDVVSRLVELGMTPVESLAVTERDGGPEAAARDARYAALDAAAERHGASAVLLGHTRDDQAETVLLGLARGSGIRSLSGMAAVSGACGRYRRPFLHLDRQTARKACMVQSLPVGTTRTTPTRPTPAPGCATRACPPWRRRSARESSRPSPGRHSCPVTTPTPSTPGPARPRPPYATRRASWSARSSTPCRPPYAAASAPRRHRGGRPGRFAVRPPHRRSRPADHRLARPGSHQSPGKVVAQRQGGRLVIRQAETGPSIGTAHAASGTPHSGRGAVRAAERVSRRGATSAPREADELEKSGRTTESDAGGREIHGHRPQVGAHHQGRDRRQAG